MAGIFPVQSSRRSQKNRTELIGQGQRMSNWLYNIAQMDKEVSARLREEAKLLQATWDRLKNEEEASR